MLLRLHEDLVVMNACCFGCVGLKRLSLRWLGHKKIRLVGCLLSADVDEWFCCLVDLDFGGC